MAELKKTKSTYYLAGIHLSCHLPEITQSLRRLYTVTEWAFRWCCSAPQGSPGVGRNTFLSSPHLCFVVVCICDLFVSRGGPLVGWGASARAGRLCVLGRGGG